MDILAKLIALLLGLVLHEFAHALMGHYLGDTTAKDQGRLTLNPMAHIDPFATLALPLLLILIGSPVIFAAAKPVPFNPWALQGGKWGAALVAAAGPATNLLIAMFFALFYRFLPFSPLSMLFFQTIIITNIALAVFNLIPFPPLDGSRVLYAAAPEGVRDIMDRIEKMGFVAILLFMFVGYQFIAPVVGKIVFAIYGLLVPTGPLP